MRAFSYRKTFLIGFGFLGVSVIWPIFNQYIPIFLQAGNPEFERQLLEAGRNIPDVVGFGLGPSLALFIMTWDNLINVFFQPWVGERSDRTWTRFGRRKPWLMVGVPIALFGFVLIPFAQGILALAVFVLITNIGMALFRSPTVSWLGDLFLPADRSKANGIINFMGGVGGLIAFFGGGILFERYGRTAPFIGGAIVVALAAVVVLWRVREPRELDEPGDTGESTEKAEGVLGNLRVLFHSPDHSGLYLLLAILLWFMAFNALESGLSSFAVFSLGISPGLASIYAGTVTVSFILFALPAGWLGTRFGKRRPIQFGLAGLTLLFAGGFFLIQGVAGFVIVLALAGFMWAMVNVNSLPLVYEHGDERRIGAFTGLYYFSSQAAAVLGPTLAGVTVDLLGDQYRWLFIFSALFMAFSLLVMMRVRPAAEAASPAPSDPVW